MTFTFLHANAPVGDNKPKPQFACDRFLVKLTKEAITQTQLPQEYNTRSSAFGIRELDGKLSVLKATAVIRAHIRPKDTDWEEKTGFNRWFVVQVPVGTDILKAVTDFGKSKWIEEVQPDHYFYPMFTPNDTFYANNWGHNNTVQFPAWSPANNPGGSHSGTHVGLAGFDSNAQLAWDGAQSLGNANIIIAIIDSGFEMIHPDIRYVTGYDFGCGDPYPDYTYNEAHGTCTAGIAAGKGNNSLGITGVAGYCSIMPLKVADSWGYLSTTGIKNALVYAADHGADVISMSFGSTNGSLDNTYYDNELFYAYNAGIPMFAATGNDNHSPICYPAYNYYVMSVGAASPDGQRKSPTSADGEYWWGSNWGSSSFDRYSVDIMGPTILPTTDIMGGRGYSSDDYERWFNGTSCATPYVAGVAALLKCLNPSLTPNQVYTVLAATAIDMDATTHPGWDQYTGYGLVNAQAAVNSVSSGIPYCKITTPITSHGIIVGTTIRVEVLATDPLAGTGINRVEFYLDNATTPSYTDSSSPYYWDWNTTGILVGTHSIKAKAFNNAGSSSFYTVGEYLLNSATDEFEATYLATLPWVTSGNADWYLDTYDPFCGSKDVRSGEISTAGQTSVLSCTLNITTAGTYSFYRRIFSQLNNDVLKLYIDGALIQTWTGNYSWGICSGSVTSGVHTFKWEYTQGSGATHVGKAFLDHLTIPAYSTNTNPDIQWWPQSFTENLDVDTYSVETLHISNWNSPTVNFLAYLPCTTQSMLNETFPTLSTIPLGWTSTNETGSRPWTVATGGYNNSNPTTAYDGLYNARFTCLTAAAITRLTAPVMDLSLATSAILTFWHTQVPTQSGGSGGLGVYYKTSSGGTWTQLASYSTRISDWTREIITLPNLSSTYYISFVGAGSTYYTICVDKVVVTKQSYEETSTPWTRFETTNYITGSIGPMSSYSYMVQFTSIGLSPGTYTSQITITSNCTANPVIIIPLTLNVGSATLSAPTNLSVVIDEENERAVLTWSPPEGFGFPTGYNVYKAYKQDFSDAVMIGTVPSSQTVFYDPVTFTQEKAFYKVTTVRE